MKNSSPRLGVFLDFLVYLFFSLVLIIFLLGGFHLRTRFGLIDVTDLKLFGGVLGLLLLLRRPTGLQLGWQRFQSWASREGQAGRRVLVLLGGVLFIHWIYHVMRHWSYGTDCYDLFFVHQPLFHTWAKPFLKCDVCYNGTYLGEHLTWTLALVSPLTFFFQSDEWVFFVKQVVVLIPILLGLRYGPLGKKDWLFAAFLVLCLSPFRYSRYWDFREDELGFLFSFLSALALYRGWIKRYLFFLLMVLLTKEHYAFIVFLLSVPILFDRNLKLSQLHRTRLAIVTAVFPLLFGALSFKYILPLFNNRIVEDNNIVGRFPGLGRTPIEILSHLIFSPKVWLDLLRTQFLTRESISYLVHLLGPVLYFLRVSPSWLAPVVPGIAMNLLSSSANQKSLHFHYELVFLPYLVFGAWQGVSKLRSQKQLNWAVGVLLALIFSDVWILNPRIWPELKSEEIARIRYLHNLKDNGSIIAADSRLLGHLSRFKNARNLSFFLDMNHPGAVSYTRSPEVVSTKTDRTGIPGFSVLQATRVIIDQKDPSEKVFLGELLRSGWLKVSESSDGQYVELRDGFQKS